MLLLRNNDFQDLFKFQNTRDIQLKPFTKSVLVLMMSKIYFFSSYKVCRTLNQNVYNNVSCGITLLYC